MSADRRQLPGVSAALEGRGEADRQTRIASVRADVLVGPNQPRIGGRRRPFQILDPESDVDVLRALEEILVIALLAGSQSGVHAPDGADVARLDRARIGFDAGSNVGYCRWIEHRRGRRLLGLGL